MASNISSDAVEDSNLSAYGVEDNISSSDALEDNISSSDALEDNISSSDALEDNISSLDAVEDRNTSLDTVEDGECNLTIGDNSTIATEENDIRINEEVTLPWDLAVDHHDVMICYDDKSDAELVRARNLKKFLIANCKKNFNEDCGFDIKVLILQDDHNLQVAGKGSVMEKAHDMCTLYFLLVSTEFLKNESYQQAKDMYIWESLRDADKKWSVIPLRTKKLTYTMPKTLDCLTGIHIERDMIGDLADINDKNLNVDEIEPRPPFEKRVRMLIKEKVPMRKKRQEELEKKRNEYKETELHKRRLQAVDEKVKKERTQTLREQEIRNAAAVTRKNLMEPFQALELSDEDEEAIIIIEVTKVDTSGPIFLERLNDPDVYPVKHTSRGRAVIISNEIFKESKMNRRGSEHDRKNLEALLRELGFTTVVHCNKTAKEMEKIVDTESKCEDHAESDSFIMAVLSHGSEEGVSGTDSVPVKIQEKIKKAFDGRECRRLAGKPKLFIIQACQGQEMTKGVWQADASEEGEEEDGEEEEEGEAEEAPSQLFALGIQDEYQQDAVPDPGCRQGGVAHEKGDMCFFHSTVSGYQSWRNTEKGTWFIRSLVKVFMRNAHKEHVNELLNMVSRDVLKVSRKAQADKRSNKKFLQLPEMNNTIFNKWYLFPGYTPPPPQK